MKTGIAVRWVIRLSFVADGILSNALAKLTPQKTPIVVLTIGASLSTVVLVETAIGSAFGLASGIFIHAALGVGMILMSYRAPELFQQNTTWVKNNRPIQWFVRSMMVLIALALGYLVVFFSLKTF